MNGYIASGGLEVDLIRIETRGTELNDLESLDHGSVVLRDGVRVSNYDRSGTGDEELQIIYEEHGQNSPPDTDEYLFVGPEKQGFGSLGQNPPDETMALFVPALEDETADPEAVDESPYESELAFVSAHTTMHEIGHSFCLGRADDGVDDCDDLEEVYSGGPEDPTFEYIGGSRFRTVMVRGFVPELYTGPLDGSYFIFSIEELLTIQKDE